MIDYLKTENEKDVIRYENQIKIESERNEIEKEKVKCIKEILEILKKK